MRRYPPELLRSLRNDVDIAHLIADVLDWPSKTSEGQFRFLCPLCSEFNSATNSRTNLARCFRCQKNFNPIDMVMTVRECSFVQAVKYLRALKSTDNHYPTQSSKDPHRPVRVKLK